MKTLPSHRPRRNRQSESLRNLVAESEIKASDLIFPLFVTAGSHKEMITSMPEVFRLPLNDILSKCEEASQKGLHGIALFPAIENSLKSADAAEAYNPEGLIPRTLREIKKRFPQITVFSDVALDPYSSDGHDGLLKDGKILNDESLEVMAKVALCQAQAGADFIAPSDMMDGRVGFLREALDSEGFKDVGILSYTAKYASSLYGPFREALDSAPKAGDKKTYQMDPRNRREALRELELDLAEGADMVLVKPASTYLDIVSLFAEHSTVPVVGYQVSGEYAMIKAAAQMGWLEEEAVFEESLLGLKRAGADLILSYYADQLF